MGLARVCGSLDPVNETYHPVAELDQNLWTAEPTHRIITYTHEEPLLHGLTVEEWNTFPGCPAATVEEGEILPGEGTNEYTYSGDGIDIGAIEDEAKRVAEEQPDTPYEEALTYHEDEFDSLDWGGQALWHKLRSGTLLPIPGSAETSSNIFTGSASYRYVKLKFKRIGSKVAIRIKYNEVLTEYSEDPEEEDTVTTTPREVMIEADEDESDEIELIAPRNSSIYLDESSIEVPVI